MSILEFKTWKAPILATIVISIVSLSNAHASDPISTSEQLIQAVKSSDIERVSKILKDNGSRINRFRANLEGVFILGILGREPVDLEFRDEDRKTALMISALNNDKAMAELLVDYGANINTVSGEKDALSWVVHRLSGNRYELLDDWREMIDYLIQAGADASPLLSVAITFGHLDLMHLLLNLDEDIDLEHRDSYGCTPLCMAVVVESVYAMESLIARGSNVNANNSNRGSLVEGAIHNFAAVKLLIDSGAEVDTVNLFGLTPLMTYFGYNEQLEVFKLILGQTDPAALDAQSPRGDTALLLAAEKERWDEIVLLLDAGADPTVENDDGVSALHVLTSGPGQYIQEIQYRLVKYDSL